MMKLQLKSKLVTLSRLGILAFLVVTTLGIMPKGAYAADEDKSSDFVLVRKDGTELRELQDSDSKFIDPMSGQGNKMATQEDVAAFVKAFAGKQEYVKFAEAVREFEKQIVLNNEKADIEKLNKDLLKKFEDESLNKSGYWGGKNAKDALISMIKEIFGLSEEDLNNKAKKEFLSDLFDEKTLKALGIEKKSEEKPHKKDKKKKDENKDANKDSEADKRIAELEKQLEEAKKQKPVGEAEPQLTDRDRQYIEDTCFDEYNKRKPHDDGTDQSISDIKDLLKGALDAINARPKKRDDEQKPNNLDALKKLAEDLNKPKQEKQAQAQAPSQSGGNNQPSEEPQKDRGSVADKNVQDAPQQPPQPYQPMPKDPVDNTPITVRNDLDPELGNLKLGEGKKALTSLTSWTKKSPLNYVPRNGDPRVLMMAYGRARFQIEAKADYARREQESLDTEATNLKNMAARLQKNAEQSVNKQSRERATQLEAEVGDLKEKINNFKGTASMALQNDEDGSQRQAFISQLTEMQSDMSSKQKTLAQLKAKIQSEIDDKIKPQIQEYQTRAADLEATAKKLGEKADELDGQAQEASQNADMYQGYMMGPQQQPAGPRSLGALVNGGGARTMNSGARAMGANALNQTSTMNAGSSSGKATRGSLGSQP